MEEEKDDSFIRAVLWVIVSVVGYAGLVCLSEWVRIGQHALRP